MTKKKHKGSPLLVLISFCQDGALNEHLARRAPQHDHPPDDYHAGAADSFRHWLLKGHPKLVQFAGAIDPIVGGRFIRAMRANLFTWALLPAMHEYIGVYNDSKRGEVNANDLAKAVTVYLDEPHRPAMAQATALLYCDLYSPCLHQHKSDNDVLETGKTWRPIYAELLAVTASPELILQRLEAGEPVLNVPWSFQHKSESRVRATRAAIALLRAGRCDSPNTEVAKAVRWQLLFALSACEHYARGHLVVEARDGKERRAGRLTAGALGADGGHKRTLLERTKAHSVNCYVESMFAFYDNVGRRTSSRVSLGTASALTMCKQNDVQGMFDALSDDARVLHNANAKKGAAPLFAEYAAQKAAASDVHMERRRALAEKGKESKATAKRRFTEVHNSGCLASPGGLDVAYAACEGGKGKRKDLLDGQLRFFRLMFGANESVAEMKCSDGGRIYGLTHQGVRRDDAVLLQNIKLLMSVTEGSNPLAIEDANLDRRVKRAATFATETATSAAMVGLTKQKPARLAKFEESSAQQAKRCKTIIDMGGESGRLEGKKSFYLAEDNDGAGAAPEGYEQGKLTNSDGKDRFYLCPAPGRA